MKKQTLFEAWLEQKTAQEIALRELNEAFDPKDEERILDIVRKAAGNPTKADNLARAMANKITDYAKAIRRQEAAEAAGEDSLARIFAHRASLIRRGVSAVPYKEEEKEEEKEEMSSSVPQKTKLPPPPKQGTRSVGDYFKISAKMILKGDVVGISDRKNWRFITPRESGNRQIEMNAKQNGSYSYRRGRSTSGQEASSHIDKSFLEEIGDYAVFYIKATKVSGSWIEGNVCFTNGLAETDYLTRIKTTDLIPNGPELKIFLDNKTELNQVKDKAKFFIGDENVMNGEGDPMDDIVPGSYAASALNHELTARAGEPVLYCVPEGSKQHIKHPKLFFCKLSVFTELKDAISEAQLEVVAKFFSKEIGAKVTVTESWNHNWSFNIPWFKVISNKSTGYLASYDASPFFSLELAEKHLEEVKASTEKLPFNVNALKVESGGSYSIDFLSLMDYAKLVGIEVKLRQFFEERRGAVSTHTFGI